jgi:tetratricopeptide (TPR) repeat protein
MLTEVGEVELADVPQMEKVRADLLAKAQRFYQTFLEQRRSDHGVRGDVGRGYRRLGFIQESLGDYPAAERAYRQAIDLQRTLAHDPPSRAELAKSYNGLAIMLRKSNRFQEAEMAFREALRLSEQLAAEAPTNPEYRQALAQSRYHLGALLAKLRGQSPQDEQAYREAVLVQRGLVAAARGKPEQRRELVRYLNNLGILLRDNGEYPQAEQAFREAIELSHDPSGGTTDAPAGDRWQRAQGYNNLGVLLRDTRRDAEAESAFREARGLQGQLTSDFPNIPDYRKGLALTESNLGLLWARSGTSQEVRRVFEHALKLQGKLVADFPRMPEYRYRLALTRLTFGTALEKVNPAEAEATLRESLKDHEALAATYAGVPEYVFALGNVLFCLGDLRAQRGELSQARSDLNRAIHLQRNALDANPRNPSYRRALRLSYQDYAVVNRQLGLHAEAAAAVEELPRLAPDDADSYRSAAFCLAQCVDLAARDAQLSQDKKGPLQQAYARSAVEWLRKAFEKRLIADPHELDNRSLDPIREREDFQKLQWEMEQRTRPVRVASAPGSCPPYAVPPASSFRTTTNGPTGMLEKIGKTGKLVG